MLNRWHLLASGYDTQTYLQYYQMAYHDAAHENNKWRPTVGTKDRDSIQCPFENNGDCASQSGPNEDPANLTTGKYWNRVTDLSFSLPTGETVNFWRKYSSTELISDPGHKFGRTMSDDHSYLWTTAGYFGPGWIHTFRYFVGDPAGSLPFKTDLYYWMSSNDVRVVTPDNGIISFSVHGGPALAPKDSADPDFRYWWGSSGQIIYQFYLPGFPLLEQGYRYKFKILFGNLDVEKPMGFLLNDLVSGFAYFFDSGGKLRKITKDGVDWCWVFRPSDFTLDPILPHMPENITYLFLPSGSGGTASGIAVTMLVDDNGFVIGLTKPAFGTKFPNLLSGGKTRWGGPRFGSGKYLRSGRNRDAEPQVLYTYYGADTGFALWTASQSIDVGGGQSQELEYEYSYSPSSNMPGQRWYPPELLFITQSQNGSPTYEMGATYNQNVIAGQTAWDFQNNKSKDLFDYSFQPGAYGIPTNTIVAEAIDDSGGAVAFMTLSLHNFDSSKHLFNVAPTQLLNYAGASPQMSWRDSSRPKHYQDAMGTLDTCFTYGVGEPYGNGSGTSSYGYEPNLGGPANAGFTDYDARVVYLRNIVTCPTPNQLTQPSCADPAALPPGCRARLFVYDDVDPFNDSLNDNKGKGTGKLLSERHLSVAPPGTLNNHIGSGSDQWSSTNYSYNGQQLAHVDRSGWTLGFDSGLTISDRFAYWSLLPGRPLGCAQNSTQLAGGNCDPTNQGLAYATYYSYGSDSDPDPRQLKKIRFANGESYSFSGYDETGLPTQITDPNGIVTKISGHNEWGGPLEVTTNWGQAPDIDETWQYYPDGNPASLTLNAVLKERYEYNWQRLLTKITEYNNSAPTFEADIRYDRLGDMTQFIKKDLNPAGAANAFELDFTYDGNQNVLTQSYPGGTATSAYNDDNLLKSWRDYAGNTFTFKYTPFGKLYHFYIPGNTQPWQFDYDFNNNLSYIWAPGNIQHTQLIYDDFGRLVQVVNPDGVGTNSLAWQQMYTALDLPSQTIANGVTAKYSYNSDGGIDKGMGRVSGISFAPVVANDFTPGTYSFTYGTTPANHDVGRVNDEVIKLGGAQTYEVKHIYTFDGLPAQDQINFDSFVFTVTYTYDSNRNLQTISYPTGTTVTNSYINFDKIQQVTATETATTSPETFTFMTGAKYMPMGQLWSYQTGSPTELTTANTYLNGLFPTSKTVVPTGSKTPIVEFHLTPDANLNVKNMTVDSENWQASFGYDALNQLVNATPSGTSPPFNGQTFTYDSSGLGLRSTLQISGVNGTTSTYSYQYDTQNHHPNQLTAISPSGGQAATQYAYDTHGYGRVTGISTSNWGQSGTTNFTYNFQSMIDSATVGGTQKYQYQYDTKNHRVAKTLPDGTVIYYIYDAFDRLIAEFTHKPGDPTTNPSATREYYYARRELIGAADIVTTLHGGGCGSTAATIARAGKMPPGIDLVLVCIFVTGSLPLLRWRRSDAHGKIRLTVLAGVAVGAGAIVLVAAGRLHAMGPTSATVTYAPYWVHTDYLGAPIKMTDQSGNVVWETWYEPFGATAGLNQDPQGLNQTVVMNVRRPGQYFDAETGLIYNWRRYYDPIAGRFLQPELPSQLAYQTPGVGLARPYNYVLNNPLLIIDCNGEKGCIPFVVKFGVSLLAGTVAGLGGKSGQAALAVAVISYGILSGIDLACDLNDWHDKCEDCMNNAKAHYQDWCWPQGGKEGMPSCYTMNNGQKTNVSPETFAFRWCAGYCQSTKDLIINHLTNTLP